MCLIPCLPHSPTIYATTSWCKKKHLFMTFVCVVSQPAFAWSYISVMAGTSHGNYLFPLSNHCRALDPVLRQIHSKHSDRCIHKNSSGGPGECSDAALNHLSTEQLSQLPFVYPPCRRVGEAEQRKVVGTKWDEIKLRRRSSGRKDNFGCDNGWADVRSYSLDTSS